MNKVKFFCIIALLFWMILPVAAQQSGKVDNSPGRERVLFYENTRIPAYMTLSYRNIRSVDAFFSWMKNEYKTDNRLGFRFKNSEEDYLGYKHYRFIQTFDGYDIIGTMYILHEWNNQIISSNGLAFDHVKSSGNTRLSKDNARQLAIESVGARVYMWQIEEEENHLKKITGNKQASWYPEGRLVWINPDRDFKNPELRLAYEFDIYASEPVSRQRVYIDAETGQVLFTEPLIHTADSKGTAVTKYSGVQYIVTDSLAPDSFRLRETGRGNGIETYNMQTGSVYANAVDFYDDDNYWNNFNAQKDEVATDAHWGAEMTYDFYKNNFNRNSIDNNGFKLISYVHYRVNYSNAFWNGQWMTYGDGTSSTNPYVALDIVGHEISHGLTTFTANLIYQSQSGALNEGFSDIFGNMIEYYGKPNAFDWRMGENTGRIIRDMSNPNARGNPDTYKGLYWFNTEGCVPSSSNDNCGVHNNSGVLNYWFYLLCEGGSGTNDLGNDFWVPGLGKSKASAIAYRTLTAYLFPSADYFDARTYSLISAGDLYGDCSDEVKTVARAWYAVGIGDSALRVHFEPSITQSCAPPLKVTFDNQSDVFEHFYWDFGDGDTSSQFSPVHEYTSYGTFTVTLIGQGNCGNDTFMLTDVIKIDSNLPCIFYMSKNSQPQTIQLCHGKLYDDGGKDNYSGNIDAITTISPVGATKVSLHFKSFAFEGDCDCDWLYIYDGPDTSSPLIGKYTGFELPEGGIVSSTGPSITIRQYTDPYKTFSGFELEWFCSHAGPPFVDFDVSNTFTCDGKVDFKAYVFNDPTGLEWDFGDGTVSYESNPVHIYNESGVYTVKLKATNKYGSDSVVKENFIVVNRPAKPITSDLENCGNDSFMFVGSADGTIYWYENMSQQNPVHIGDTFMTPVLNQTTSYYVENVIIPPVVYGGLPDKDQGGGGYYSYTNYHALIFDCFKEVTLKSVKVYADGESVRHIVLKDKNGQILQDTFANIPDGEQRVNLNFELPVGTDLELGCEPVARLYRNNSGIEYPIILPGILTITSNTAARQGYSGYYYFFYDWEIQEKPCISPRKKVTAYISHNKPAADFDYQADGLNVTFSDKSTDAYLLTWDFGDGTDSTTYLPQVGHTYSNFGNYWVNLKAHNACGDDSTGKKIVLVNSIRELSEKLYRIYPNPVQSILVIESLKDGAVLQNIGLYDVSGKLLKEQNYSGRQTKWVLSLQEIPEGIYFLKITDNQGVSEFRIWVK